MNPLSEKAPRLFAELSVIFTIVDRNHGPIPVEVADDCRK